MNITLRRKKNSFTRVQKPSCIGGTLRELLRVQKIGKNHGGYYGETIDIGSVLQTVRTAALARDWAPEVFHAAAGFEWLALHRGQRNGAKPSVRLYLSTGIHGDEPAGPLAALRLLQEDRWPAEAEIILLPCLNPMGFTLNRRENPEGKDLNRDYLHLETEEIRAHHAWLNKQAPFDLALCLHEDWEAHGFYVYELNPDGHPHLAESMVDAVAKVCPVDPSPVIEGRPAVGGVIRPNLDPATRPQWPEAFWLLQNKTRHCCTLEAPSDFPLSVRVDALVAATQAAVHSRKT